MVVSLSSGGSIPIEGWGVFRWVRGEWQLVLLRQTYEYMPVVADGSDLRETLPIFRKTDPLCCPSGGSRSRVWHWNGEVLVAGAWQKTPPAAGAATTTTANR
jgi:hypothetical protein